MFGEAFWGEFLACGFETSVFGFEGTGFSAQSFKFTRYPSSTLFPFLFGGLLIRTEQ